MTFNPLVKESPDTELMYKECCDIEPRDIRSHVTLNHGMKKWLEIEPREKKSLDIEPRDKKTLEIEPRDKKSHAIEPGDKNTWHWTTG